MSDKQIDPGEQAKVRAKERARNNAAVVREYQLPTKPTPPAPALPVLTVKPPGTELAKVISFADAQQRRINQAKG